MNKNSVKYNCDYCGKECYQTVGNYNRFKNHFCSKTCGLNFRWENYRKKNNIDLNEVIECACGCGQTLKKYHKIGGYWRPTKFINGHSSNLPNKGQFKKGNKSWNKGRKISEETKKKLSIRAKEQWKDGMAEEYKIKLSCRMRKIPLKEFNGFVCNISKLIRHNKLYKEWRNKVYRRDNYICQKCGNRSNKLRAHHIIGLYEIIKECKIGTIKQALRCLLLWSVSNGVTLCNKCHKEFHEIYGIKDFTEDDYKKWIKSKKVA